MDLSFQSLTLLQGQACFVCVSLMLLVSLLFLCQNDSSTGLKVTPEDLFNTFQRLTDENMKV